MAISIGDLVANVDADISGLTRGFKQAEAQIQHLGRAFKTLESGILVPASASFTKVEQQVDKVAKTAKTNATPAINAMRGAFGSMAAQALRIPGPIGAIAGQLGTLAVGTLGAAGILGGITLVTALITKLGEESREAKKLVEEFMNLDPTGVQAQREKFDQLNAAYERLRKLQREVEEDSAVAESTGNRSGRFSDESLGKKRAEIAALEKQIGVIVEEDSKTRAEGLKKHNEELERIKEKAEKAIDPIKTLAMYVRDLALAENAQRLGRIAQRIRDVQNAVTGTVVMFQSHLVPAVSKLNTGRSASAQRDGTLPFGFNLSTSTKSPDVTKFTEGANRFLDAVDGFRNGIKDFFKGFTDFSKIGAQLGGAAVNFVAGKLFDAIGGIFESTNSAADRLARAMEQNTRAVRATGEFLRKQFEQATTGGDVTGLIGFLEETLNRIVTGKLKGDLAGRTTGGVFGKTLDDVLEEEFAKAGIDMEWVRELANQAGINLDILSEETLRALFEALEKAGYGAAEALEKLGEEISNAPAGFKLALRRYQADTGVTMQTMAGNAVATGSAVIQNYAPGAIRIDARSWTPEEIAEGLDRHQMDQASRGGATRTRIASRRAR